MNNFDTLIAYIQELRNETLKNLETELISIKREYRNYSRLKYLRVWRRLRKIRKPMLEDIASVEKLLNAIYLELNLNKNFNKYKRKKW